MSAATDLDLLKDIPEYKTILKGVIKIQLQLLVEQLAQHTEEESIILTASVSDGTLSHLGTSAGKQFLDGHDEIKTQFLGFCLSTRHTTSQHSASLSDSKVNDLPSPVKKRTLRSTPSAAKRRRIVQSTVARVTASGDGSDISSSVDRRTSTSEKKRKFVGRKPGPASSRRPIACTSTSDNDDIDSKVKLETASDNQDDEQFDVTEQNTSTPVNLPPSIHLPHTQTAAGDDSDTQDNDNDEVDDVDDFPAGDDDVSDSGSVSNIKVEPITEGEFGSEITGAEISENAEQPAGSDWGPDTSTAEGDDSVDQSPNKSAYSATKQPVPTHQLCSLCGLCIQRRHYPRHLRVRHGNPETDIRCTHCTMFFNSQQELDLHREKKHSYMHMCAICGKSYLKRGHLNEHIQWEHEKTGKRFECNLCNKIFRRVTAYKDHLNVHYKNKPYLCKSCGRGFASKTSHFSHERMCMGAVVHLCGTCGVSFSTSRALRSHKHGEHSRKRHVCKLCGNSYKWPSGLYRHRPTCVGKFAAETSNGGVSGEAEDQ